MTYEIALHALGQSRNGEPAILWDNMPRLLAKLGVDRVRYNMDNLWAWNTARALGIEADGPCACIRWK